MREPSIAMRLCLMCGSVHTGARRCACDTASAQWEEVRPSARVRAKQITTGVAALIGSMLAAIMTAAFVCGMLLYVYEHRFKLETFLMGILIIPIFGMAVLSVRGLEYTAVMLWSTQWNFRMTTQNLFIFGTVRALGPFSVEREAVGLRVGELLTFRDLRLTPTSPTYEADRREFMCTLGEAFGERSGIGALTVNMWVEHPDRHNEWRRFLLFMEFVKCGVRFERAHVFGWRSDYNAEKERLSLTSDRGSFLRSIGLWPISSLDLPQHDTMAFDTVVLSLDSCEFSRLSEPLRTLAQETIRKLLASPPMIADHAPQPDVLRPSVRILRFGDRALLSDILVGLRPDIDLSVRDDTLPIAEMAYRHNQRTTGFEFLRAHINLMCEIWPALADAPQRRIAMGVIRDS